MSLIVTLVILIFWLLANGGKVRPEPEYTGANDPLDYDQLVSRKKTEVWFEPMVPEIPYRAQWGTLVGGRIYFPIEIPWGPHLDIRREDIGEKYNVYIRRPRAKRT